MQPVDLEDYRGSICYIGADLGSVDDISAISVMIPTTDGFVFKTYCFLPSDRLKDNPNRELYQKFVQEKSLILTPGNVCDYDYIINKIQEINNVLQIQGIYYDKWNATSWAITLTELGYNMVPFSQAIGNFNAPTKEFERLIKSGEQNITIAVSANILWQFTNVILKQDWNGNVKPTKDAGLKKIDAIIAMLTALGGYLLAPANMDTDIFVL